MEKDPKWLLIDCKILLANCFSLPCTEKDNLTWDHESFRAFFHAPLHLFKGADLCSKYKILLNIWRLLTEWFIKIQETFLLCDKIPVLMRPSLWIFHRWWLAPKYQQRRKWWQWWWKNIPTGMFTKTRNVSLDSNSNVIFS